MDDVKKQRADTTVVVQSEKDDGSSATTSSYASPKDHISVSSSASETHLLSTILGDDPPTVTRLQKTTILETQEKPTEQTDDVDIECRTSSVLSPTSEERPESNGVTWVEDPEMVDGGMAAVEVEEPEFEDELSYEHRPIESTPTRRELSRAARELTTEGVPKADRTFARNLSGLTAEVLGDEGRANSPLDDNSWRQREKHFFILSRAGKPIYSRYGDEGALCGMMAILEAIHSVVQSKGEETVSITDGPVKIVFLSKGPLLLVGVSRRKEVIPWILKQLDYLFHHVLCLATGALLKVLNQSPGQDIRHLLKGSAPITEGLIQDYSINPGLFLGSFFPVRMLKGIRQNAYNALAVAAKGCRARVSFLLFDGQVVCMHQDSSTQIDNVDLLLLLNFVLSNDLYRSQSSAEFNAPVCMPHLHETAFLHAYIYFIEKDPDLVVVLLMTQPDAFHLASEARKTMEKKLREVGVVHSLRARKPGGKLYQKGQVLTEELPLAAGGGQRELSAVQTFLLNRRTAHCPQYILCQPSSLIKNSTRWKCIVEQLASIHAEYVTAKKSENQKVHWFVNGDHAILYDCSADWEMYLVCDPLTLKEHASSIQKEIIRFLLSEQVKEELFMLSNEK